MPTPVDPPLHDNDDNDNDNVSNNTSEPNVDDKRRDRGGGQGGAPRVFYAARTHSQLAQVTSQYYTCFLKKNKNKNKKQIA